ncbi:hypothetical protein LZ32DRAFT_266890 [Colletotrichum eremochloae]|nr:hypothetical protein LZ32DRAFT_266890 [Colletotrichum eremochloae]
MAICFPVCIVFFCAVTYWSWDSGRSLVPASRRAQKESTAVTMAVGVFCLYIWMTVGVFSLLFVSGRVRGTGETLGMKDDDVYACHLQTPCLGRVRLDGNTYKEEVRGGRETWRCQ